MNKRIAKKKSKQETGVDEIGEQLAGLLSSVPGIQHAVEEVAEDNLTLMQAVKRVSEGQDALRAAVLQEIGQLRTDVAGELVSHSLRTWCRELSPVVTALDGMLAGADFSDSATIRQHVESLALTLLAALGRMGIERIPVVAGADLFDSQMHECVRVCTPADSPLPGAASRTVVRVQEAGYTIRGRVAMPARVWVQKIEVEAEVVKEEGANQ